jgi:hypothetical protein
MAAYETAAQYVLSRRPIVIFPDRGNEAQREWIVFWEEDPQSQQKTPMTWNNELTTEEDRLTAIREDVLLKRADAKGAIELFTRKKAHWENELKKAEARYTATCEYFIYVYTKNIEYFQRLSDEQPALEALPGQDAAAVSPLSICDVMNDLLSHGKIIKKDKIVVGNRIIDPEYWIKTTVEDVLNYLKEKYPKLDAEDFMRKNLKGKNGGNIGNSFRVKKSINNPLKNR